MSALRKSMNNDAGTAVVEFIFIGVLLLVPILYATLMVMRIEAAAMASTHAVREGARAFMMADTRTQGLQQARLASAAAMSDQGFTLAAGALRIDCSSRCLEPGTQLRVNLDWRVDLPWLPPPLAGRVEGFPISAEQSLTIDSYRDSAA
ncbi:unannotated protein [freshwater metagenome]|uniref:Unannotated protein n=1 Tax=freshwater metagenome TaxID=449393 RepID=A0A6J6LGC1_9ZZZZ|nr:hypothetical protein [Actinomycetota bacterium]MSY38339.1 hypothetical protein [Actinomycetota bacterium]